MTPVRYVHRSPDTLTRGKDHQEKSSEQKKLNFSGETQIRSYCFNNIFVDLVRFRCRDRARCPARRRWRRRAAVAECCRTVQNRRPPRAAPRRATTAVAGLTCARPVRGVPSPRCVRMPTKCHGAPRVISRWRPWLNPNRAASTASGRRGSSSFLRIRASRCVRRSLHSPSLWNRAVTQSVTRTKQLRR